MGSWTSNPNGLKSIESPDAVGVLAVKVYPRSYDTPTIPDGMMQVDLTLAVRAEVDSGGVDYLAITDIVSNQLQKWQKAYDEYAPDFRIQGEFEPTGFNMAGGDVGLDKELCVWQYSATFNIYGIMEFQQ